MKQETFDTAQILQTKIADLDSIIPLVVENKAGCSGKPLNISFCFDEDFEDLQNVVINHMKTKRAKLKKQFDNLK